MSYRDRYDVNEPSEAEISKEKVKRARARRMLREIGRYSVASLSLDDQCFLIALKFRTEHSLKDLASLQSEPVRYGRYFSDEDYSNLVRIATVCLTPGELQKAWQEGSEAVRKGEY